MKELFLVNSSITRNCPIVPRSTRTRCAILLTLYLAATVYDAMLLLFSQWENGKRKTACVPRRINGSVINDFNGARDFFIGNVTVSLYCEPWPHNYVELTTKKSLYPLQNYVQRIANYIIYVSTVAGRFLCLLNRSLLIISALRNLQP